MMITMTTVGIILILILITRLPLLTPLPPQVELTRLVPRAAPSVSHMRI
jgi:hypothetical protein